MAWRRGAVPRPRADRHGAAPARAEAGQRGSGEAAAARPSRAAAGRACWRGSRSSATAAGRRTCYAQAAGIGEPGRLRARARGRSAAAHARGAGLSTASSASTSWACGSSARSPARHRVAILGMVQCAPTGSHSREDHPDVPVTLEQIVDDAVACHAAVAASCICIPAGRPTGPSRAAEYTTRSRRRFARPPRTSRSGRPRRTSTWRPRTESRPSGNGRAHPTSSRSTWPAGRSSSASAPLRRGIGIEAGVFMLDDADARLGRRGLRRFTARRRDHRRGAMTSRRELARAMRARRGPWAARLWHGEGQATWAVVDAGLAAGVDVRVGQDASSARRRARAPDATQVAETAAQRSGGTPPKPIGRSRGVAADGPAHASE